MRRGDYAAAWAISDDVLRRRDPATRDDPRQPYHLRWVWDGRSVCNRHVLVRCYHGLGDTLQFARYLPVLAAQAASLTVEVQHALLPLIARLAPRARLVAFREEKPLPPADCDIEIMELLHVLRLPPPVISPPYLHAPPTQRSAAIGLCWRAGDWDPDRSLPLRDLAPALGTRAPWCLQPAPPPPGLAWRNPAGCSGDLAATAALVASLGLVITVDTMIAHLSGALGRPTWLLLKHNADWRWMDHRDESPWYPAMRLFRQPAPGDWGPVVRAVADRLARVGAEL